MARFHGPSAAAPPDAEDPASLLPPDRAMFGGRVERGSRLAQVAVLSPFYLMPVGLLSARVLGFRISGFTWIAVLGASLLPVWVGRLSPRVLSNLVPLFAYLGIAVVSLAWTPDLLGGIQVFFQLLAIAVIYVLSWRVLGENPDLISRISRMSVYLIPAMTIVFLQSGLGAGITLGWLRGNSARPMVMGLSLVFVIAAMNRSRRTTFLLGFVAISIAIASGGRMGSAVLILVFLLTPSVGLTWRGRGVIAATGLTVLLIAIPTQAFQDRFFLGSSEGTFLDIVTLQQNFNTAGRSDIWPGVLETCNERPLFGFGVGAAGSITLETTDGELSHPHNEFIRTYCDGGLVGTTFFWLFFALVGVRAVRLALLDRDTELGTAAALLVLGLLLFSLTDNVTIYTGIYMTPSAVIFAASDRRYAELRAGGATGRTGG